MNNDVQMGLPLFADATETEPKFISIQNRSKFSFVHLFV